jgi:hypothetical protein
MDTRAYAELIIKQAEQLSTTRLDILFNEEPVGLWTDNLITSHEFCIALAQLEISIHQLLCVGNKLLDTIETK